MFQSLFAKLSNRAGEIETFGIMFAAQGAFERFEQPGKLVDFKIGYKHTRRVWTRLGTSDREVFKQVFRDRQYDLHGTPHDVLVAARYRKILAQGMTPIVVDCGANIGASALWFIENYPEAKIIAVEPDNENVELCRRNVAGLNVDVVEAAVGGRPGEVSLKNRESAYGVGTQRTEVGEIPVVTINEMIREQGQHAALFLVKIDIEGFESDLFSANIEWINQASAIMIEPHDYMGVGSQSSHNFQRVMGDKGFDILIRGENLVYIQN